MFFTNFFYNLKKVYDYLMFPIKRQSQHYSKKYSQEYSKKYIDEMLNKSSPSISISSENYAGSNPPSYDYNNYSNP